MLVAILATSPAAANPAAAGQTAVSVVERHGVYAVSAQFTVAASKAAALAVLADYEQIPAYVPEVRRSVITNRSAGRTLVEQEAESSFMFFSKRVHLLLEIVETDDGLRFTDVCGRSFVSYEGSWRIESVAGGSLVTYELRARPAFDVPEFLLKRLLKRDAARLVDAVARRIEALTKPASVFHSGTARTA